MEKFDATNPIHREGLKAALSRAGLDLAILADLELAKSIRALISAGDCPESEKAWDQRISGAIEHIKAQSQPARGWVGCVYGKGKVGKSTFATFAPNPLICDVEDGLGWIECEKLSCNDWTSFLDILKKFVDSQHQTLVIDTADMIEKHLWEHIMFENKLKSMKADWHAGYALAAQEWVRILRLIRSHAAKNKKNFLFTAHQKVATIINTEGEAFEQASINLHKDATEHFFAQMDFCAHAHFETVTRKNENKDVLGITSGKRLLNIGCETLSAMVGNRFNLTGKLPMDANFYKLLGRKN